MLTKTRTFTELPLSKIDLGDRRRTDYGSIEKLAAGIKRVGLLHPLIVQPAGDRFTVVVGGRRFKALQSLKVKSVPVRLVETLTDEELREIELEENDNRKDFTERERHRTFKASKQVVEDVKKVAEVISTERVEIKTASNPKGSGRKPKHKASKKDIAQAMAVSTTAIVEAERHVETAEQYPFMQADGWLTHHVLEAKFLLNRLPDHERPRFADILAVGKGAIDPKSVIEMLNNLVTLPAKDRTEIYAQSISLDSRERDLALTRAAARPPMPDPRLREFDTALDCMKTAYAAIKRAHKLFPEDPLAPRIDLIAKEAQAIIHQIENARKEQGHGPQTRTSVQ